MGRKAYLTVLNVVACLSVVILHTNFTFWWYAPSRAWVTSNAIECVFIFAVPIFFMVSGATLLDYRRRYTTKDFFKKRAEKTLIPFVFWSIVSVFFTLWHEGKGAVTLWPIGTLLTDLLNANYMGPYWFFFSLFSVYISMPMLSAVPEEKRRSVYGYGIIAAGVINLLIPFLCSLTEGAFRVSGALTVESMGGYLFFVLLGYWIDRYPIRRRWRVFVYILGLGGLLLQFFGTWGYSVRDGAINSLFKGYLNVPCALYAAAVFLFFKHFPFDKLPKWFMTLCEFFGGQTFGIYLIHQFIITLVTDYFNDWDYRSIVFRTLGAFGFFLLSSAIVWILKKLPLIRRIVP